MSKDLSHDQNIASPHFFPCQHFIIIITIVYIADYKFSIKTKKKIRPQQPIDSQQPTTRNICFSLFI